MAGSDYRMGPPLHESARTLVCRASAPDGRQVVVKRPAAGQVALALLDQYRREAELLTLVGSSAPVPQGVHLESVAGVPWLVMDDAGATDLARWWQGADRTRAERLSAAIELAQAAAALHQAGILHGALYPGHVLVAPGGQISIIDFQAAQRHHPAAPAGAPPNLSAALLPYLAPEMTGRMNRPADLRADLYAVGAILYHLFTGRAPFVGATPLEVVHAHLSVRPEPPSAVADVSAALSQIIERLLEKEPERRYQSAVGLVADLTRAAGAADPDRVAPFVLGSADVPQALYLSPRLYGQADVRSGLAEAVAAVSDLEAVDGGGTALVLVLGGAGAGKTAWLQEVRARWGMAGLALAGSWEVGQAPVPYAAVLDAMDAALMQLLALPDDELAGWRDRILKWVGDDVLLWALPHWRALAGPAGREPRAGPPDLTDWRRPFQHLLLALAEGTGRPVLLTLDNLHAADVYSLAFLTDMLSARESPRCLVVAAGTPPAAGGVGPWAEAVAAWAHHPAARTVSLEPLSLREMSELLADSFQRPGEDLEELAVVLVDRSRGNPRIARQQLNWLAQRGGIQYDGLQHQWTADIDAARQLEADATTVGWLLRRLKALPPVLREVLRHAAVLGPRCEAPDLARMMERPAAGVESHLMELAAAGLLHTTAAPTATATFVHPDLQQAVYRQIPRARRQAMHLAAARALAAAAGGGPQLHQLIAQYGRAGDLVSDPAERLQIAGWHLEAARLLMPVGDCAEAVRILTAGISYLPPDAWDTAYPLSWDLHILRAEALFADHHVDALIAEATHLRGVAKSLPEQARCAGLLSNAYTVMDRPDLIREVGIKFLAAAGITLPERVAAADVRRLYRRVRQRLRARSWDEWKAAPLTEDPLVDAMSGTMLNLANTPDPHWANYMALLRMELGLKRGWNARTAWALSAPARFLNLGQARELDEALALAEVAETLVDRLDDSRARFNLTLALATHLGHLRMPYAALAGSLQQYYEMSWRNNIPSYGLMHAPIWMAARLAAGDRPAEVLRQTDTLIAACREQRVTIRDRGYHEVRQVVARWAGEASADGREGPEALAESSLMELDDRLLAGWLTAWDAALFADAASVYREAVSVADIQDTDHSNWLLPEVWFWEAWALTGLPAADADTERRRQARVRQVARWLTLWAERVPDNFLPKRLLLQAEQARRRGAASRAADGYDEALAAAERAGLTHEAAFISEQAAVFHTAAGHPRRAQGYWVDAYRLYQRWGHVAKAQALRAQHPEWAPWVPDSSAAGPSAAPLDLEVVVDGAAALAQEIQLDRLVQVLVALAVKSAGADRAALVMRDGGAWRVSALAPSRLGDAEGIPLAETPALPRSVVQYVIRTGERVLMDDVAEDGQGFRDAYLRRAGVRSLLCVPVKQHGQVSAVLYLENRVAPAAFAPARVGVIELLAGQAAISIENARAYATLEHRVAERTEELERTLESLRSTQRQMVEAEKMASLGQLTAGVAHEINNPVNFVVSSVPSLRRDLDDLQQLMDAYEAALAQLTADHPAVQAAAAKRAALDADYVRQEVASLMAGISEGAERTAAIVKGLRNFSRLDEAELKPADVRDALDTTLMLLRQQFEPRITVEREYGDVPWVECYPGQLNQVFMNLLANAGQAIEGEGVIRVRVESDPHGVAVRIQDSGSGIPPHVLGHIFEPFFTTKPVGQGTGLGLSISYGIVERHHGRLTVDSELGKGTAFTVWLPLQQPEVAGRLQES